MGNVNLGGGGGISPIGLLKKIAIGGVIGNQIGGMMITISNTVPPSPYLSYYITFNAQQLAEVKVTGYFITNSCSFRFSAFIN